MNSRIFKPRFFARQMQKIGLSDELLLNAVDEMERGLIDANLGGGVVKKRVALPNRGKSGSTRTLIATKKMLSFSDAMLDIALIKNDLQEINHVKKI
ncbi:MAG: type II toxin-antitoxin system RelE/ParE family toxin [Methylococcales bacterium]|nr:type II toxin-antitoxin system RelE/ParE family toxin [Methylococcales bacterium]